MASLGGLKYGITYSITVNSQNTGIYGQLQINSDGSAPEKACMRQNELVYITETLVIILGMEQHEKEGLVYILGVVALIVLILGLASLTHVVL
ncbi:MAG: hypothetical protein V3U74_06825 [Thermodesulfobacteriota bacterium]